MGIMVYSLKIWVMQDLDHQPYEQQLPVTVGFLQACTFTLNPKTPKPLNPISPKPLNPINPKPLNPETHLRRFCHN